MNVDDKENDKHMENVINKVKMQRWIKMRKKMINRLKQLLK